MLFHLLRFSLLFIIPFVSNAQKIVVQLTTPAGVLPKAIMVSPDGKSTEILQNTSIALSVKGTYTISSIPIRKSNALADELYSFPTKVINVVKLDSVYQVQLTYTQHKGTGMLWTSANGNQLLGFDVQSLQQKISEPSIRLETPTNPILVAADTLGNLWYWDNEFLYKIHHSTIASGRAVIEMKVSIPEASNSLFNANSMKIDSHNQLMLSLNYDRKILVINLNKLKNNQIVTTYTSFENLAVNLYDFTVNSDASQLAISGEGGFAIYTLPKSSNGKIELSKIAISKEVGSFTAVDFDTFGNLWLCSINGGVFKLCKEKIKTGAIITTEDFCFEIPTEYDAWGIMLDNSNNVWIMPRNEQENIGVDFYETKNSITSSSPTFNYTFSHANEHGKFCWNMLVK